MFQNLGIKSLCLLMASLLWLQAAATSEVEEILRLPVEVVGLTDSLTVIDSRLPDTISVRVRGSRLQLLSADLFSTQRGAVRLDLEGREPGRHRYDVSVLDVSGPGTPLDIVPEVSLEIQVERRVTREFPVELTRQSELPSGVVMVTEMELSPARVEVEGPQSLVDAITVVKTQPFVLGNRTASFSERIRLVSPGPELVLRPVEIQVTAGIEPIEERIFESVPLTVLREDDRVRIELIPAQARVIVRGPRGVLAALRAEEISALVTIPVGVEGVSEVEAEAVVPDGVISARVEPQSFQVLAEVDP